MRIARTISLIEDVCALNYHTKETSNPCFSIGDEEIKSQMFT